MDSDELPAPTRKRKQTRNMIFQPRGKGYVKGARWNNEMEILFIDLMHGEVLRGNLLDLTFPQAVWNGIQGRLNKQGGHFFSVKQLQEKRIRIKRHWRKFRDLMLENTSLGWDSKRELPLADDNWWAIWEQAHPDDVGLRSKPCKRYLKLCTLFERNTAAHLQARSSAQVPPVAEGRRYGTPSEPINVEQEDEGMDCSNPRFVIPTSSTACSSNKRKIRKQMLECLTESFETTNNSITSVFQEETTEKKSSKEQCKECMRALRALPNVSTILVVRAVKYFAEPVHRTLFLLLDPPEQRALLDVL